MISYKERKVQIDKPVKVHRNKTRWAISQYGKVVAYARTISLKSATFHRSTSTQKSYMEGYICPPVRTFVPVDVNEKSYIANMGKTNWFPISKAEQVTLKSDGSISANYLL